MSSPENPDAFKHVINSDLVKKYADGLKRRDQKFDANAFKKIIQKLPELELRGRVRLIANALREHLPHEYDVALSNLMTAVRRQGLTGFSLWPATEFIELFGHQDFDSSFAAMRELTVNFTSEFAVRPFIRKYQGRALKELAKAARDPNVHLRRWASEGSRPRLPWGERLQDLCRDPKPSLAILEILKFDPEIYVRKSVANHLNDIAKDHPERVVETLKRWQKSVPSNFDKEFKFILNRSLRSLIKSGHPEALKLVGIKSAEKKLLVKNLNIFKPKIKEGQSLEFSFELKNISGKNIKYLVDYVVWHQRSNNTLSPKVFKLKGGVVPARASLTIEKKHSFKTVTTRVYYSGEHHLEIQVNGKSFASKKFSLLK